MAGPVFDEGAGFCILENMQAGDSNAYDNDTEDNIIHVFTKAWNASTDKVSEEYHNATPQDAADDIKQKESAV